MDLITKTEEVRYKVTYGQQNPKNRKIASFVSEDDASEFFRSVLDKGLYADAYEETTIQIIEMRKLS